MPRLFDALVLTRVSGVISDNNMLLLILVSDGGVVRLLPALRGMMRRLIKLGALSLSVLSLVI